MEAAIRVVKYIKKSPGMEIIMSSTIFSKLQAYCDVDWGSCLTTRKSVSGYAVKIGDSLISWNSKKHSTVSKSSARQSIEVLLQQSLKLLGSLVCLRNWDYPFSFQWTNHVIVSLQFK